MNGIWGLTWSQLGATGLLGLIIVLFLMAFFSGRLLPRSLVKLLLDQAAAAVAQAQKAEAAADARAEAERKAGQLADQRADLALDTMRQVTTSVQQVEVLVRALSDARRDAT